MANQLEGRRDGETVWVVFPSVDVGPAGKTKVNAWVHEATVFSARHGLVQLGRDSTPRAVHIWCETVHDTSQAAWQRAAEVVRRAGMELLAKAAEFEGTATAVAAREGAA